VTRRNAAPLYLVDLPGYGYARGGANDFAELAAAYFGREGREGREGQDGKDRKVFSPAPPAHPAPPAQISALLLVDSRHPGLQADVEAWQWLRRTVDRSAVVATKVDKLARGERMRALRQFESVFDDSVLPVSAVTGEGMDDLWKLIAHLQPSSSRAPHSRPRNSRQNPTDKPALPHRKNSSSRR